MGHRVRNNILIVLLVIIFFIGGYLVSYYNIINIGNKKCKNINTNNNKDNTECIKDEISIDTTRTDILDLYNMIINREGACENNKLFIDKKVNVEDLTLNDITDIMLYNLYKDYNRNSIGSQYNIDEIQKELNKIFGSNLKYVHQSSESCNQFIYDSNTGIYTVGESNCIMDCNKVNLKRIVKVIKRDNYIDIYVRVLFVGLDSDNNYYSDYNRSKLVDMNNNIDYVFNEGSLYKLVFKLDFGNYVFKYSEPTI